MNYSDHGSVVDGVLYSCDFSDKPSTHRPPSPPTLTLDDVSARGTGLRAFRARARLETTRKSLEDRERAQKALEGALKLVRPFSREVAAQPDSTLGKRTTENSSVVSIPLSKTKKICTVSISPRKDGGALPSNHDKASNLKHSLQVGISNATIKSPLVLLSSQRSVVRVPAPVASVKPKSSPLLEEALSQTQRPPQSLQKPCMCKRSASNLVGSSGKGWEGTAVLYHGSRVRFGCVQFVLSIAGRPGHSELVKTLLDLRGENVSRPDCSESSMT